jgi:hypothetical protein
LVRGFFAVAVMEEFLSNRERPARASHHLLTDGLCPPIATTAAEAFTTEISPISVPVPIRSHRESRSMCPGSPMRRIASRAKNDYDEGPAGISGLVLAAWRSSLVS